MTHVRKVLVSAWLGALAASIALLVDTSVEFADVDGWRSFWGVAVAGLSSACIIGSAIRPALSTPFLNPLMPTGLMIVCFSLLGQSSGGSAVEVISRTLPLVGGWTMVGGAMFADHWRSGTPTDLVDPGQSKPGSTAVGS